MLKIQRCHFVIVVLIPSFALAPAKLAWASGRSQPAQAAIQTQPSSTGWFDDAVASARKALDADQRTFGAVSPGTADSLNYLAGLLYERGDYAEAETLYLRELKVKFEKFGLTENPEVAASMNHIAEITRAKGELTKAEGMYQENLKILEKVGPGSPEIVVSLNGLAEIYRLKHDYDRAEPLYTRALEIWVQAKEVVLFEPKDPELLNNLGQLYRDKGDVIKAEQFFQRAIKSYDSANYTLRLKRMLTSHLRPPAGHLESLFEASDVGAGRRLREYTQVAGALQNLGDLYRVKGDYAAAEPLYRRALDFREQAFGKKHRLVAETLSKLALLLLARGDKAGAAELQLRANEIGIPSSDPDPSVRTDRTLAGLAGPVHTVVVERTSPSGPIREEMVTYDNQGRKTERLNYTPEGTLQGREVYRYDQQNRLQQELRYDSKDVAVGKTVHSFDSSGKRTESIDYDQGGTVLAKTTYTYDANGNLTKEKTSRPGFPGYSVSYSYNAKGELTEKTTDLRESTRYQYEDGKLTEEFAHFFDDTRIRYDSRGNKAEEETTSKFGRTYTVETYKYNYDVQGNWTKQAVIKEESTIPDAAGRSAMSPPPKKDRTTKFHQRTITYY